MPMATEPTLEQLSAYVDGELDSAAGGELEGHLQTCSSCRARLDGLRQTVSALRALPMETPPRAFTVPAQPRRSWHWAPLGWATSGAAAAAIVIFWVSQAHLGAGVATSSVARSLNSGAGRVAVAPLSRPAPAAGTQDRSNAYSALNALSGQQVTVTDPAEGGRSLTVSTDARSYRTNGVITLRVSTNGVSPDQARTITIFLSRDRGAGGYAVRLAPPSSENSNPTAFDASYAIQDMHLQSPQDGNYSLQVSVDLSGGQSLIAHLPVTITP